jgi:hypothetical protein
MEPSNEPVGIPPTPILPQSQLSGNEQVMAIASLVMGVLGLCATFFIGICGAPFPIIGLILGYLAMKDPQQKTLAIIGIAFSGLTLLGVCLLTVLFSGLMILGPTIGNVFSQINQSLTP